MDPGEVRQGEKKIRIFLAVLVGLLLCVVGATGFYMVHSHMKEKNYNEAIATAKKYLSESNYEDAVVEYKKAISVNPLDDEAYLGLAEVYLLMGDVSNAKAILNRGYEKTKSVKIEWMLQNMETEIWIGNYLTEGKVAVTEYDLENASEKISMNSAFFQKILNYTFEDYKREFGKAESIKKNSDGYYEVKHAKLDGICYYRNTDSNRKIMDESRNVPYESAMPEKISVNSVGLLFRNFEGAVNLERLQMLLVQRVQPETKDGRTFIEADLDKYILRIETDQEGNIVTDKPWNEIILVHANKQTKKSGHMSGVVMDAVTGAGVEDAVIAFEPSGSQTPVIVTSGNQGLFEADLEPGTYQIVVTAKGYVEEKFSCQIEEGKNYSGIQFVISPDLESGTARIVLEWNAQPQDLDSYLFGKTDNGEDVLVKYSHMEATAGGKLIASLDLDDVDGYGPETTTIHDLNGVYTFTVADYNRTGTMKANGATVKVYLPGEDPEVITISSSADVKDIWNVCEIDHGKLKVINSAPAQDSFSPANK